MNEAFINKNRIFVRYNKFIDHRKTVILIHGVSGSMSGWDNCIDGLGKNYNLILFDLRGHGRSHKYMQSTDYQFKLFSEDLLYVLNHFKVYEPCIVAHSFAYLILIDFVTRFNCNLGKLILLSARLNTRKPLITFICSMILKGLRIPRSSQLSCSKKRHINYNRFPSNRDLDIKRSWIDISNTGLFIYLSCIKCASQFDPQLLLKQIETSCLFIHGENDLIAKFRDLRSSYKDIANATLVKIKNANHVMIFSHSDEITSVISAYIDND